MTKTIRALVTPEVLKWARDLNNITIEEAAKMMKVSVEKMAAWEDGSAQPTIRQAKTLAKKYKVYFVDFYLPDIPKKIKRPNETDYRTFGNKGAIIDRSRELLWLERDIEDRRNTMLQLYKDADREPVRFSHRIKIDYDDDNSEIFAREIRKLLGLTCEAQKKFRNSDNALKSCIANLEKYDVLIFQAAKINPSEMRGLSVAYDVFPMIVLNRKDETSARLFTLCHELVHIISRTSGICNDMTWDGINKTELFCNKVAGLALVPTEDLKENTHTLYIKQFGLNDHEVQSLGRDFAVSREVIIHRLWDIGVITKGQYYEKLTNYSDEYLNYSRLKKKDGHISPAIDKGTQVGKLYASTVLSAYSNETITSLEASQCLLDLGIQHFDKIERWCFK